MKKTHLLIMCMFICSVIIFFSPASSVSAGDYPTYRTDSKVSNSLGEFCENDVFYFVTKKPVGSEKGEVYATGCKDSLTKLVLEKEVEHAGKKYIIAGINDYAYEGKNITSVTLKEGISYIGRHAFYNCAELTKVKLPQSVTEVGDFCFYGCRKLKTVNIPHKLESIPEACFSNCVSISKIVLGDSVKELGKWAFSNCSNMKTVKLNSKLEIMGPSCFSGCKSLVSIKLPASLKTLGEKCFYYCESIKSITIPKKIKTVPVSMCEFCYSLEWVKLGRNVKTIDSNAFGNCKSLKEVKGGLNVKVIGYSAFGGDESLVSYNFSSKLTKIDDFAFYDALLSEFDIPNTVQYIGEAAFSGNSFETISIPGSVKEIGKEAFNNCKSIKSVKLEEGVEIVGKGAFGNCNELTEIDFSSTVHTVYISSVNYTPWLSIQKGMQLVTPQSGKPYYSYYINGKNDYSGCTGSIIINDVCIWVDPYEYSLTPEGNWNATQKTVFEIPSGVKKVSLTAGIDSHYDKVVIPEGVEELDGICLQMNSRSKAVSVILPDSLKRMNGCIYGEGLKEITIPKNVEYIGDGFFTDATALEKVTFAGKKLKEIGNYCFMRSGITSIILPDSVTTIGNYAFIDSALSEITLPKSLKTIGKSAFSGTEVKKLTLPDNYEITSNISNSTQMTLYAQKGTKAYKVALKAAEESNSRGSSYKWKVSAK